MVAPPGRAPGWMSCDDQVGQVIDQLLFARMPIERDQHRPISCNRCRVNCQDRALDGLICPQGRQCRCSSQRTVFGSPGGGAIAGGCRFRCLGLWQFACLNSECLRTFILSRRLDPGSCAISHRPSGAKRSNASGIEMGNVDMVLALQPRTVIVPMDWSPKFVCV